MTDLTIPEPEDKTIVAWMSGGVPTKVYVRMDCAVDAGDTARWFNADEERGTDEGGVRWFDLHPRHRNVGWSGPYRLNVGELLGGEPR